MRSSVFFKRLDDLNNKFRFICLFIYDILHTLYSIGLVRTRNDLVF